MKGFSIKAWTRQIDTIEIQEGDAITDSSEAYNLMMQQGISNVIVMGVHMNMCVCWGVRSLLSDGISGPECFSDARFNRQHV